MPPAPPVAFATLAQPLPGSPRPYIVGITPTSQSSHLVLRHPEPEITIADNHSLQAVQTLRGHSAPVTAVRCEGASIWSSSKDATIVRWDERTQRATTTIKAFVRKPLPVTALAVSDADNLVMGGTELLSSEAHILFWDIRNTTEPAYKHSSTHSDDITHLSLLPPTSSFASSSSSKPLPQRLFLSASTDGCVAMSDLKETDDEEALQAEENWNQSVADAGTFMHKGQLRVWARSDMDYLATWAVGTGEGETEGVLEEFTETNSDQFKARAIDTPQLGPNIVQPAGQAAYPPKLASEYLIDVCPSLGTSNNGAPIVGAGSNSGDIVLEHSASNMYTPSAFLLTDRAGGGHKDVVRCMYHSLRDEALYTGSEDGVLAGWSLAGMPLASGDAGQDDADEQDDSDSDSEMEIDDAPRSKSKHSEPRVERRGKEKRKEKRHQPY